jgi:hypothetical protein
MKICHGDTHFSVTRRGGSSVQEARILGIEDTEVGRKFYLDRLLDLPGDPPEGWRFEGVVSTIAISNLNPVVS